MVVMKIFTTENYPLYGISLLNLSVSVSCMVFSWQLRWMPLVTLGV